MANSRFSYVRDYELADRVLPNTFMLVRIDGKGFHKFSATHQFAKPNDKRALDLMDRAARHVMTEMADVIVAFGESDEYSFLLRKGSTLYNRRESKIVTLIVSLFTSAYVFHWGNYFPDRGLDYPPVFDGRLVVYPSAVEVKDYFKWRGVDTHINNLYNTTFWALVQQGGQTTTEAHKTLSGSFSKDKNEILFSRFGINYSSLPAQYRRGTTLVRVDSKLTQNVETPAAETCNEDFGAGDVNPQSERSREELPNVLPPKGRKVKKATPYDGTLGEVVALYEDIIKDDFWDARPWLCL